MSKSTHLQTMLRQNLTAVLQLMLQKVRAMQQTALQVMLMGPARQWRLKQHAKTATMVLQASLNRQPQLCFLHCAQLLSNCMPRCMRSS